MNFMRRISIYQRLLAVAFMTLLIVGGLVTSFAVKVHDNLIDARNQKTQHIVQAGLGVLEHFHALEKQGQLSQAEAQEAAVTVLEGLRYGDDDYYWVHDYDLKMVRHPFSPHLNGKSIAGVQDPNGTYVFRAMNKVVNAEGEGLVNYAWPKPGKDQPVPKVSYVIGFEPWGWVLGSGIYLDDVRDDFWASMAPKLLMAALGLCFLAGLSLVIAGSIVRPLRRTVKAMNDISTGEGDLTRRLETDGNDEIALLAHGFNEFTGKLANVIDKLRDVVNRNREISVQVGQAMTDAKNSYNRQKQELEMVATAVEQMNVTAEDVAQRMTASASAAQDASQKANQGQERAQHTRDAMERLATEIASTSRAMEELGTQSHNIGGVLDVIRGVAEQTNLLALNAAIEAARAGEQGRGFAVVADEVRTLASRAHTSTDEIHTMIAALQSGTTNTLAFMEASYGQSEAMRAEVEDVKTVLVSITDSITTITDMTYHVASAAEEQSQTANTIAKSLTHLARLSDDVLVELNDTANNTTTLSAAAEELVSLTNQFRTARN